MDNIKILKQAFTLAEVLITLGIIGIVAAMTVPTLIANIQRKNYTTKLKKFYSTMNQAVISAEDEFGAISDWDFKIPPNKFVETYFGPYLKFSILNSNNNENNQSADIIFSDGSTLKIYRGNCMDLYLDLNGDKKPNKFGYDKFAFLACDKNYAKAHCGEEVSFCTYGFENIRLSRAKSLEICKTLPVTCSTLLKFDNWEFNKDYPYK